jgi:Lrp/AsnC family leucine-responsive transcriptional regulator
MSVDKIDLKILYELDVDSRQSLRQLGKKVGLSKEVVNYRIKNMIKTQIILGFYARINTYKTGSITLRAYIKLKDPSKKARDKILNELNQNNQIGWIVLVSGNYDLAFSFSSNSMEEFSNFYGNFLINNSKNIEKEQTSIYESHLELQKIFMIETKKPTEREEYYYRFFGSDKTSEIEKKIIDILSKNARTPTIEIANKISMNTNNISLKIRKMEKEEIILGYGVRINQKKLGYDLYKANIFLTNQTFEKIKNFEAYCRQNPKIAYITKLIGKNNIGLEIYAKNMQEYLELIDELRSNYYEIIKDIETMHYYENIKFILHPIQKY